MVEIPETVLKKWRVELEKTANFLSDFSLNVIIIEMREYERVAKRG